MAKSDDLTKLFDAAQEVVRESFALALRIADERDVDQRALIRAAFSQMQALGFGMGYSDASGSAPPTKPRRTTARRPKKS